MSPDPAPRSSASPKAKPTGSAPPTPRRRCPYCLKRVPKFERVTQNAIELLSCPECKETIPTLYEYNYDRYPPVIFSLIGLPSHGKTVYLASLLHELEQFAGKWPGFSYRPLDREGLNMLVQHVEALQMGQLPSNTVANVLPRPVILQMEGVPRVERCRLLMYDTGGEVFTNPQYFQEYGAYTRSSEAVAWLLSLKNLGSGADGQFKSPLKLVEMLHVYTEGLVRAKFDPRRQMLLVVLTKGDLLRTHSNLPPAMKQFLQQDFDPGARDSLQRLEELSTATRSWLNLEKYHTFVNLAESTFGTVRYCVLSALGSEPQKNNQLISVVPRGVLAPLFWLWIFQGRSKVTVNGKVFFTVEDAFRSVTAGAVVRLEAGIYRLSGPLVIEQPLRLEGAGRDQTRLVSAAPGCVVQFNAHGTVQMSGLTVEHEGDQAAHVAWASQGEVVISDCRFLGAQWEQGRGGTGLRLSGSVNGRVSGCEVRNNRAFGIQVRDEARPVLEKNHCQDNGEAGIAYFGKAEGSALDNTCAGNAKHGIYVCGQAAPLLKNNICNENRGSGILYAEAATGAALDNTASTNQEDGLSVHDQASPELDNNITETNRQDGLYLAASSKATRKRHKARANQGEDVHDGRKNK